jgi:hypothetical protein
MEEGGIMTRTKLWTVALGLVTLISIAGPARAGTPAQAIDIPDDSFTDVNPCTWAPTTIVVHYERALLREEADADASGGLHVLFIGEGTYTGDDGYAGKFRNSVMFTTASGGTFAHAYTASSQMTDGSGSVALATLRGHITLVDGVPVVEDDDVSIRCVGKP